MECLDTGGPLRAEVLNGGSFWRLVLDAPKGNILDASMVGALRRMFDKAAETPDLKGIIIEGEGDHFSFGASVEEHLPEQVGDMLAGFHGMFRSALACAVPLLAVVRGQCLGGGLEVAAFCHRVFAAPDARLGQPEIVLGVFAPVASLILTERAGRSRAEDLCISGRIVDAQEALAAGIIDEVHEDPGAAALAYARHNLLPRSASSLRFAVRAVRQEFSERFFERIAALEKLYLEELMATHDAREGLQAFLEKRKPVWRNS